MQPACCSFTPHLENKTVMKLQNKLTSGILVPTLAAWFAGGTVYSQTQPSSKATSKIGLINVMNELSVGTNASGDSVGAWVNILNHNLKTPNQRDLFIGVSLEVGLLTDTLVKSKNGISDTSMASAGVEVQVLIDGVPRSEEHTSELQSRFGIS